MGLKIFTINFKENEVYNDLNIFYERLIGLKLKQEKYYEAKDLLQKESQNISNVIEEIKSKLKQNKEVRVISTQLVEAGVDFDFPVVYRAFSGLDSIAQAAGRCNREGKLEKGFVKVFVSQNKPPLGILRKATEASKNLLNSLNPEDPLENSLFKKYFEDLYWKCGEFDKQKIVELLNPTKTDLGIYFRTASNKFKLIDDKNRKTILVPYKEGGELIEKIRKYGPDRFILRKMQRYSVSLYTYEFEDMKKRRALEEIYPDIFTIVQNSDYSEEIGLITNNSLDELIY
jgi:CRISPR-associated endonuclease/helicase Cas3